ncbi:MAG: PD-(D/E)XK nuclease family protein, partial [Oscillospiraceae bacterium]|nr:PD-(D/E)XK nuclease family protein [Oscillospiraceae bacterium]
TLEGLLYTVEELKNAGADGQTLADMVGRTQGALSEKLLDLSLLLEAYTAAQSRSAIDPAERLKALASLIGDSPTAQGRFYLDGFSDFTALEKEVIRALLRAGTDITVCLTCGGEEDGATLLPMETARWFQAMGAEYGTACRLEWMEPGDDRPAALGYYCDHLFDFSAAEPPEAGNEVTLVTASDAYEECELAAARMGALARAGCRYRDMAVAVRGFEDYRAALESACQRYGIPLFLSGRGDTLRKSVSMAALSALEAVNRGYEYEAVFGYLKTGLSPIGLADCDRLENYVILWGIRGGQWARPWAMHPEGYNRPFDEAANQELTELNRLREQVIGPLKALERGVKAAGTAREQAMALADFLVAIEMPERIEGRAAELEAEGRRETAAEYDRLWDVICTALEQFAAVLGDMSMDGEQFQGMFSLMLSTYDVSVIPVSLDRVAAGDMDGMRRRHIKHLLVLGAADGRLPAPEQGGSLFTPDEREELAALGLGLGGPEEDMARELGLIYSCLSLPSETLYISWPRSDGAGAETRPSLVAERARALLGAVPAAGDLAAARTYSQDGAFFLALQGRMGDDAPAAQAARDYFVQKGQGQRLERLAGAMENSRRSLSPEAVRALYGPKPGLSATRAEKFGDCRFGYFLQYGLRAKPRQQAVFDPRDYGTFMHYILENVAREAMNMGGFPAITEAQVGALADKYVDQYITQELNDFADKSPRFIYLFRRLRHTVRQVTADMWRELKDSKFQPIDLELDLQAEGVLAPAEEETPLSGRADRVDGWVREGVLYLRITDYKTGVKKFSLSDVCQGVNLQMLLYLFTLEKRGLAHFGAEEIRPAGVLYVPARFGTVNAERDVTDQELAELRRTSAKRSGLVLSDPAVLEAMEPGEEKRYIPVRLTKAGEYTKASMESLASLEQFGALSRYIDKTLSDLAAELRAGSVAADPWFKSARDNACQWCKFQEACLFDPAGDGWRVRSHLTASQAWDRIGGGK